MIYRLLSTCAGLGYGFPENSFRDAMRLKLDLIAADAGSMDPGPYYLGKNQSYMEKPNLKRDFLIMLKGSVEQGCPLLLGSCGLAGDSGNLRFMLDIAAEVFEEIGLRDLTVAVIDSHVDDKLLLGHVEELKPLGRMPPLRGEQIKACRKVAQMGIAPYIKALDEGAQVIFGGRACDVAIFAADPIRKGIDPGLAFHAGHVLECGAIACDPGSGSDCLIAEFRSDNTVAFTPPNVQRRATTYSIAAHSLYEEDHPSLQFYPEGVLSLQETEYFPTGERSAGIRKSVFIQKDLSVKIEGSRKIGERVVSILSGRDIGQIPDQYPVYGRNGVEFRHVQHGESEIGLCIRVTSEDEDAAKGMLTLLKGLFMHFGYPGRRSTAGNLAFPLSPSEISYRDENGKHVSTVIGGTRDPFFQDSLEKIRAEIFKIVDTDYADLARQCRSEIILGTMEEPLIFLESIAETRADALRKHTEELTKIEPFVDYKRQSMLKMYAGEAFVWGMFHLFSNRGVIEKELFPVSIYQCTGREWNLRRKTHAQYAPIGLVDPCVQLDPEQVDIITGVEHAGEPVSWKPLREMANVIRSKDAGINKITYDIFFLTPEDYEMALKSDIFVKDNVAEVLSIPVEQVIGTYSEDACRAIKISVHRSSVSGNPGERDVFGAQQHMKLLMLDVPVFND